MAERIKIAEGKHEIYREGDTLIKVFDLGFPKAEVLNEALSNARVEELGLNVPKILAVSVIEDGRWAITKEFIEGENLEEIMMREPERIRELIGQMVDLQLEMHSKRCALLGSLQEKMSRQISELDEISEITRYELLTQLNSMPRHVKLCHGDFCPANIIVDKNGEMHLVDWVHASRGNASADAARTYLLLMLKNSDWADMYMDIFCEKSHTERNYVQNWLPLVAAAQLTKKRPEEMELLKRWVDVVHYD